MIQKNKNREKQLFIPRPRSHHHHHGNYSSSTPINIQPIDAVRMVCDLHSSLMENNLNFRHTIYNVTVNLTNLHI